jgi:thiol-disulfide isomerase/thioredoxin
MNPRTHARAGGAIRAGAVLATVFLFSDATAETNLSFALPRWKTGEMVRLQDFAGQIVVLDFFAYWCAPCLRASQALETGVQQFYAARHDNARVVPVQVLSINIEKNFPERTEGFLWKTGASFVLNDPSGSLLKQYGGVGIPFLVILDGTGSGPAGHWTVAYQHAGFEGLEKTRRIIDGLGPAARAQKRSEPAGTERSPDLSGADGFFSHTTEIDSELAWASDILLSDSRVSFRQEKGGTEWEGAFSYATYDMDYRPVKQFDFFGFPEHLHEDRTGGQANLRQRLLDVVTLLGSAGLYQGYPDYRRVWIANRYRQKYANPDFPTIPGYEEPDPKGFNVSGGARWEYLPALGFAEVRLGYARDRTAPGYEDGVDANGDFILLKGREVIETKSVNFSLENVLSRRLRSLNEFTFTETSGRELRFSYQGSLNWAMAESWVLRGYGGVSTEQPQFDAHFFGATVEWEAAKGLLVSLTGRYYQDTGEIENSLLTSSAAPALQSWEAGAGLRYAWKHSALKLYLSAFWTNYDPIQLGTEEFAHLYADRNWGLAQLAYSVQF